MIVTYTDSVLVMCPVVEMKDLSKLWKRKAQFQVSIRAIIQLRISTQVSISHSRHVLPTDVVICKFLCGEGEQLSSC